MEFLAPSRLSCKSAVLAVCLAFGSGCLTSRVRWPEPVTARALPAASAAADRCLYQAERAYAAAVECEEADSESCVDHYFQAAVLTGRGDACQCTSCRRCQLHGAALTKLVTTGERFGRLDGRSHLSVIYDGQQRSIPVTHHGFVWDRKDFQQLSPVGDYSTNAFRVPHRSCGVGIPLVITSTCPSGRPFVPDEAVFAATLVLRVELSQLDAPELEPEFEPEMGSGLHSQPESESGSVASWSRCALELYDPLRVDTVLIDNASRPLAKDQSAPLAYRLRDQRQTPLRDFFMPRSPEAESRLTSIEPYQPGKIPVVLVHGLLSNPFTWVEVVNELHTQAGFVDKFQIWLFEYPTAQPFLVSAAAMREQLSAAQRILDPERLNAEFSNMVLVGHSMGGLISKLQVTSSGDHLWNSIADRPIEQTLMQAETRKRLTRAFYFEPSPQVSRVVFIGTPHQGSVQARRLIGQITSSLVMESEEQRTLHRQLIDSNPGVFSREFSRRVPTSIDLLEPNSALLRALYELPISDSVTAHTVFGDARWTLGSGRSDGVVPIDSARYSQVVSERAVTTTHTKLDKHVDTIDELRLILESHRQELHLQQSRSQSRPLSDGAETHGYEEITAPAF